MASPNLLVGGEIFSFFALPPLIDEAVIL